MTAATSPHVQPLGRGASQALRRPNVPKRTAFDQIHHVFRAREPRRFLPDRNKSFTLGAHLCVARRKAHFRGRDRVNGERRVRGLERIEVRTVGGKEPVGKDVRHANAHVEKAARKPQGARRRALADRNGTLAQNPSGFGERFVRRALLALDGSEIVRVRRIDPERNGQSCVFAVDFGFVVAENQPKVLHPIALLKEFARLFRSRVDRDRYARIRHQLGNRPQRSSPANCKKARPPALRFFEKKLSAPKGSSAPASRSPPLGASSLRNPA